MDCSACMFYVVFCEAKAICSFSDSEYSKEEGMKMLLEVSGIVPDIKNADGNVPLHYFASRCTLENPRSVGDILVKKMKERGTTVICHVTY